MLHVGTATGCAATAGSVSLAQISAHAEYAMVLNVLRRDGAEAHADRVVQLATLVLTSAGDDLLRKELSARLARELKRAAATLTSGRVRWRRSRCLTHYIYIVLYNIMIRTDSVTEIPLRFYSFPRGGATRWVSHAAGRRPLRPCDQPRCCVASAAGLPRDSAGRAGAQGCQARRELHRRRCLAAPIWIGAALPSQSRRGCPVGNKTHATGAGGDNGAGKI
jgi:hypothetical protein